MALLWIDGFENYGTTEGVAPSPTGVMARKYTAKNENTFDIEAGRSSGKSLQIGSSTAWLQTPSLTTEKTLITGIAFKVVDDTSLGSIIDFRDLDGSGLNIYFNNGDLQVRRNVTVLGMTTGLNLVSGVWYFLEFKCFNDNTTGTYEVKINGATVLSDTGVDTRANNGYDHYDRVRLLTGSSILNTFDDFYILDTSGSTHNDFIGECKVVTLRPNGDSSVNWNASTGANHYGEIDETVADDDSTYVETDTSGDKDIYDYTDTSESTIYGAMVTSDITLTGDKTFTLQHVCDSNANENISANLIIGQGYTSAKTIYAEDHDAGANWNQTTINAAKFGIKVA